MQRARKKRQVTPTMSLEWISDQVRKAQAEGQEVTREEFELSLGCDKEVRHNKSKVYF